MYLPQSTDVSSSTLGQPGTETPVFQPLSPPPSGDIERYEKRALPPVPLNRHSGVSAFSKEVDEALATPEPVAPSDDGSIYLVYRRETASDTGAAELADLPDRQTNRDRREELKINTVGVPREAPDAVLSPQPQPRSSLPKVQKISGLPNAPAFRETTPTGHNSEKKIHRLTGLGVPPEAAERDKKIRAEQQKQLYGEVSPLSNNDSEYSHEEPRTAVSDLDGHAEAGKRRLSEPRTSYFASEGAHRRSTGSSMVPRPLRLVKPTMPGRSPERKPLESLRYSENSPGQPLSPRLESGRGSPRSGRDMPSDKSSPDLYHETAKELAKEDALAVQKAKALKASQRVADQFTQAERPSSSDSRHSSKGKQLPPLPRQRNQPHRPDNSPDTRPSGSTERSHPIWRPTNFQYDSPHTVSASTFGRLPNRLHTQHSASPSPSPNPRSRSRFDYDSDTNPHTIGTPETGGFIPISIVVSDVSDAASPKDIATTGPPHRHRRGSSSIMAKVFRRASAGSSSPTTSVPPHNTPAQTSPSQPFPFPRHARTPPAPAQAQQYPFMMMRLDGTGPARQRAGSAAAVAGAGPGTGAGVGGFQLRAKTSLSTIAAKTNDLVGAAAGFINKSTNSIGHMGLSGEERRRQRLKSSIRVLGDGGQVLGYGPRSGSGSLSGLGTETGTRMGMGMGTGGAFRGRLGSARAAAGVFVSSAVQAAPGEGSVLGMGGTRSPETGRGLEPGQGESQNVGRESPGQWARGDGNGYGSVPGAAVRSTPRQGISPRGSPAPQVARVVRSGSPRGSPQPKGKNSEASPRLSAERSRGYGGGSQGVGVGLGVVYGRE